MESVNYEVYIPVVVNTQRIETEAVLKDNSDVEMYTPALLQVVTLRTERDLNIISLILVVVFPSILISTKTIFANKCTVY